MNEAETSILGIEQKEIFFVQGEAFFTMMRTKPHLVHAFFRGFRDKMAKANGPMHFVSLGPILEEFRRYGVDELGLPESDFAPSAKTPSGVGKKE